MFVKNFWALMRLLSLDDYFDNLATDERFRLYDDVNMKSSVKIYSDKICFQNTTQ